MKNKFPTAFLAIILLSLIFAEPVLAQDNKTDWIIPKVGYACPNFQFSDVEFFSKKEVSLKDFKGKWLVLDFWSKGCASCIISFPKINELQNQYNKQVQFLSVGYNPKNSDKAIREIYYKLRDIKSILLPIAWDTVAFYKFDGKQMPYIIIVDPNGIVRGITSHIEKQNLEDLLNSRQPEMPDYRFGHFDPSKDYRKNIPLLIDNNGGKDSDYIYRTLITKWNDAMPPVGIFSSRIKFEMIGYELGQLYKYAYVGSSFWAPFFYDSSLYGKFWPDLIFETKDSSQFFTRKNGDLEKFCFSFSHKNINFHTPLTKDELKYVQKVLRQELENTFNSSASIETRKMPCYYLISTRPFALVTKGGTSEAKSDKDYFVLRNQPISRFVNALFMNTGIYIPIYNSTGFEGNIDIDMHTLMTDFDQIKESLQKNGLDIISGEKEMKVLVVK